MVGVISPSWQTNGKCIFRKESTESKVTVYNVLQSHTKTQENEYSLVLFGCSAGVSVVLKFNACNHVCLKIEFWQHWYLIIVLPSMSWKVLEQSVFGQV